jgi:hypothetical protein
MMDAGSAGRNWLAKKIAGKQGSASAPAAVPPEQAVDQPQPASGLVQFDIPGDGLCPNCGASLNGPRCKYCRWTAPSAAPQYQAAPPAAPPMPFKKPLWKKWWFWVLIVLALSGLGRIVGSADTTDTPTRTGSTTSPTASAPTVQDAPSPTADASAQPTQAAETPATPPKEFTMPDLVGMNLQEGQDLLQSMDSFLMDQEDASGQGRIQMVDSNWKICNQDPQPGATATTETTIRLAAVKLDEQCP